MLINSKSQNAGNKNLFGYWKSNYGFTLVELLIVIAILGGLAAIFMSSYPASQRRARDSIRRSDIKQYQTAMEVYANKTNGRYFVANGAPSGSCGTLGLTNCPNDPRPPNPNYRIISDLSQYTLWATLEDPDASGNIQFFISCSSGRSGECTTAPSSAACPAGCP